MSSHHPRTAVFAVAAFAAVLALRALAQTPGTDNRDGYFVNYEEPPIHPMELSSNGTELWVVNLPDSSVSILSATTLAFLRDVDVGLGPVTIRRRPGGETPEMWVACHSTGSVFVIDETLKIVRNTIPLGVPDPVTGIAFGSEPCDIVFDSTGSKAYVSLSILNQIAEIDCVLKKVNQRFEFGSLYVPNFGGTLPPGYVPEFIHAEEPRSLVIDGSTLYGLSFESGNGTVPVPVFDPNPERPIALETVPVQWWDVWTTNMSAAAPHIPPPDRDLFSFALGGATPPTGEIALWRMGSFDFDVLVNPNPPEGVASPQFLVSNVDFKNTLLGEHQFPTAGIARHRVSIASPWVSGTVPPQPTTHVDLNDPLSLDPGYQPTVKFGVPNEMALSSDGSRLYVACYETKSTAVLSVGASGGSTSLKVVGALKSSGAGPRGVLVNEAASRVYVYNRADNTVDAFATPAGVGFEATAAATGSIGVDVTPVLAKAGRKHHIDAANSGNGLQSCNTCHMDVHHDRIGWDLGEFSGNLALEAISKDAKKTKVTMSLRGIEETAPFHWRGDRADLVDFNPAFQGLLGGSLLDDPAFAEFQAFIFNVSYPPNPRQRATREFSDPATAGLGFFTTPDAHAIGFDTVPTLAPMTCAGCHSMAGFSGTNNQVNNDFELPLPEDATQLRGLFDKESDVMDLNAADPTFLANAFEKAPATFWGFGNGGSVDTVRDFVGLVVFQQTDPEKDDIAQFLSEFDTGSAPATAFAWTLNARTSSIPAGQSPVETYLELEAASALRNCDAVVRGAVKVGGVWLPVGMRYDGASTWISNATRPPQSFASANFAALKAIAAAGNGIFTFIGVPVGSGHRLGLDGDMDFLPDGEESFFGASKEAADWDGDGAPDGYEVRNGTDPNDGNVEPTETVAPGITPPAAPDWSNSNIAKIRWTTDEEATSRIVARSVTGPIAMNRTFEETQFKKDHVLVVRGMNPGQTYSFTIEGEDPNGNAAAPQQLTHAMNPHLFDSVHVKSVTLLVGTTTGGAVTVRVTATVVDQNGIPVKGCTLSGKTLEWLPGGTSTVTAFPAHAASNAQGRVSFAYTAVNGLGSGATVEPIVISIDDTLTKKIHFHPHEKVFSAKTTL